MRSLPGKEAAGAVDQAKQSTTLVTYTSNTYTNPVQTSSAYRTPLIAETCTYQLINVAPQSSVPDITAKRQTRCVGGMAPTAAPGLRRQIGCRWKDY